MSRPPDDLIARLDALYAKAGDPNYALAMVDYWPEIRDRLTAAEAERDAAYAAADERYQDALRAMEGARDRAQAERDEAVELLRRWDSALGTSDNDVPSDSRAFLARLRDRSTDG